MCLALRRTQLLIVVMSLLLLKVAADGFVPVKCCPQDEALTLDNNGSVYCVPSNSTKRGVYTFDPNPDFQLETCDIHMTPVLDVFTLLEIDCLDELRMENLDVYSLVSIVCTNYETPRMQLKGMKKCCNVEENYDPVWQECVPANDTENSYGREIMEGTVYAKIGTPKCFEDIAVSVMTVPAPENINATELNVVSANSCIDQSSRNKSEIAIVKCNFEDCLTCIPTCARANEYLHPVNEKKVKVKDLFWTLNSSYESIQMKMLQLVLKQYVWVRNVSKCTNGYQHFRGFEFLNYKSYFDAKLFIPYTQNYIADLCIDWMFDANMNMSLNVFTCQDPFRYWGHIKQILMTLSCIFVLFTLFVYITLPSLRNLYGKSLIIYLMCCLSVHICWLFIFFDVLEVESSFYFGHIRYFFSISRCLWITAISYDMWSKLGIVKAFVQRNKKSTETREFIVYNCICWSVSIFLTGILVYDEFIQYENTVYSRKNKRLSLGQLLDYHNNKLLGFYVVPIALLIFINILFFLGTSRRLSRIGQDINNQSSLMRFKTQKRNQLLIIIKLFVIMGLLWIVKIPKYILSMVEFENKTMAINVIYLISDIAELVNGILTFAAFCLKRRIYKDLKEQCSGVKKIFYSIFRIHQGTYRTGE